MRWGGMWQRGNRTAIIHYNSQGGGGGGGGGTFQHTGGASKHVKIGNETAIGNQRYIHRDNRQ